MVYIKAQEAKAKNLIHPENIIRTDTYLLS